MTRYAQPFGAFHLDTLPNQPQVAHCHSFHVRADQRGKGLGHTLKRLQMQALADGQFDYATCTVDAGNAAQISVLTRSGWGLLAEFSNSRTGGKTQLWGWEVGGQA